MMKNALDVGTEMLLLDKAKNILRFVSDVRKILVK
jgi:hypothetical protein